MAAGAMSEGAVIWAGRVDLNIGPVHVFVQRTRIAQRDARRGNRAPQRGGRIHHRRGLRIGNCARERALVDVVLQPASGPVHRLAHDGGVEVRGSGNVLGPAGKRRSKAREEARARNPNAAGRGTHGGQARQCALIVERRWAQDSSDEVLIGAEIPIAYPIILEVFTSRTLPQSHAAFDFARVEHL